MLDSLASPSGLDGALQIATSAKKVGGLHDRPRF